jgi:hypothetical protein
MLKERYKIILIIFCQDMCVPESSPLLELTRGTASCFQLRPKIHSTAIYFSLFLDQTQVYY